MCFGPDSWFSAAAYGAKPQRIIDRDRRRTQAWRSPQTRRSGSGARFRGSGCVVLHGEVDVGRRQPSPIVDLVMEMARRPPTGGVPVVQYGDTRTAEDAM